MATPSPRPALNTGCCVVLMMKSPARSKRRLAEHIGAPRAARAAALLLDCAREDLAEWPGPTCASPSAADERSAAPPADTVVVQPGGNLGKRIVHVNGELLALGFDRQIFIGSDCPGLDLRYLERAAAALAHHDTVLGPARDGGVVLMGVRGRWPLTLADLPWSTDALFEALRATCAAAGSCALLAQRSDVDRVHDLIALRAELCADERPARRAFASWLAAQSDLAP